MRPKSLVPAWLFLSVITMFLSAPVPSALCAAPDNADLKVLEERISKEKEINEIRHKELLERLETIDRKNAELTKKSDEYSSKLFGIYTAGAVVVLTVLGLLGFTTIKNWIKSAIEKKVGKIMSEEKVREIIKEKGEPAVQALLDEWKSRSQTLFYEMEQNREEYKNALEDVKRRKKEITDLSKPLSDAVKQELETFVEKLAKSKVEETYTADDWFYKGLEEYRKGDFRKSADSFEKSFVTKPTAKTAGNIALSYQMVGDFDKTEEYYKKAINIEPKHANNLGNYALFLTDIRQDYDKAEEYYKMAIEADPKNSRNLSNYAIFLKSKRQDHDKAEEYYKRAIETDPKNASRLCNYAVFLKDIRKDQNKAEEYYKRAIETDPKNEGIIGNYGFFLFEKELYPEALEFTQKALDLQEEDWVLFNKGHILLAMGKFDEAREVYSKGLDLLENHDKLNEFALKDFLYMKGKGIHPDEVEKIQKWLLVEFEKKQKHDLPQST